jgi:uncharacterized cupredoxin-like copper-binding protein
MMFQLRAALQSSTIQAVLLLVGLVTAGGALAVDPYADERRFLQGVDWNRSIDLVVEFEDNLYEPEEPVFIVGQPYILTLYNRGRDKHDLVGGDFFSAIVIKEIRSRSGRVGTFRAESLYVYPGEKMELWFVPRNPGRYEFYCTLPGHRDDGMEGIFHVRSASANP